MNRTSMVLRWVFTICTAAVVVAGEVWLVSAGALSGSFNAGFVIWLLIGLAPCAIFAFGARTDRTARVHGSVMLLVTVVGWLVIYLSGNEFAGLAVMAGFFGSMAVAITAAASSRSPGATSPAN
jgi:hypothetical protein